MKKVFALLLILSVLVGMVGCPDILNEVDIETIGPFEAFTAPENTIGILTAESTDRSNDFIGDGTSPDIYMTFLSPADIDATEYTLQHYKDGVWIDYEYYGDPLKTASVNQDNFAFSPDGSYSYRLAITNGLYDGYVSNTIVMPISSIETHFSGWSLNEGIEISGVMTPWVGRGLDASFSVVSLSDDSEINTGLSYQWYRMNPVSYEMSPIIGATELTYITTLEDLGYLLAIKATGDESTVGGFSYIYSQDGVQVRNDAVITNIDHSGFTLDMDKRVLGLDAEGLKAELELKYYVLSDEYAIPIASVFDSGDTGKKYNVSFTLPDGVDTAYLENSSHFWSLGGLGGIEINF